MDRGNLVESPFTGSTSDHYEEYKRSLLTLGLKTCRVGFSWKTHGGKEFQSLGGLAQKLRSNWIPLKYRSKPIHLMSKRTPNAI